MIFFVNVVRVIDLYCVIIAVCATRLLLLCCFFSVNIIHIYCQRLCFFPVWFYALPPFWGNILYCFPSFCVLFTFVVADYFAHFVFFRVLALHCCIVSHMYMYGGYLDTPYTHTIPLYDLWHSCADLFILVKSISPPQTVAKIMTCETICVCVCLVLRLLGANASPCTHTNSSPPSWVPPCPFMSETIFVSF